MYCHHHCGTCACCHHCCCRPYIYVPYTQPGIMHPAPTVIPLTFTSPLQGAINRLGG